MYENIEILTKDEHKDKGIKTISNYDYAKDVTTTLVLINEYYQACKDYPIVFVKEDDEWKSLVVMGLDGSNDFVNKDGEWSKNCYIPAFIRRYPFIYVSHEDELLLASDSSAIIDANKSGDKKFFDKDGEPTEFVKDVLNYMNEFQLFSEKSKSFIEKLDKLGVLEPANITRNLNGKEKNIGGFWIVSEEKLSDLKSKDKTALCKENLYQPITAHLISLSNVKKLSI